MQRVFRFCSGASINIQYNQTTKIARSWQDSEAAWQVVLGRWYDFNAQ
jgi:hypothetical protein